MMYTVEFERNFGISARRDIFPFDSQREGGEAGPGRGMAKR